MFTIESHRRQHGLQGWLNPRRNHFSPVCVAPADEALERSNPRCVNHRHFAHAEDEYPWKGTDIVAKVSQTSGRPQEEWSAQLKHLYTRGQRGPLRLGVGSGTLKIV